MSHLELGKKGEQIARELYTEQGYVILDTNYRFEKNEIDLIAFNLQEIVFVEVKTRSSEVWIFPEVSVDKEKQKRIKIAAQSYLYERKLENCPCRFDVVSIVVSKEGSYQVKQFIDAFR
jgi:putative endonuclease